MLNIHGIGLLASLLDTNPHRLIAIADSVHLYCEDLILKDPAKPDKPRDVLNVKGALRTLQTKLYTQLLAPRHLPSKFSHGGVRGRNIKTNAAPHRSSTYVFTTDVESFYPSIHSRRVYELFAGRFGCSPDVARICTRLCTYRYHLALGLITSPILADCMMIDVDRRIGAMCRKHQLVYTRFVDDITISGPYAIDSGSFPRLVSDILQSCGLKTNHSKEDKGRLSDGKHVTKLRIKSGGRLDVSANYVTEVRSQLDNSVLLARGIEAAGPYYLPSQIRARIQYIVWINRGSGQDLMRRYKSIRWDLVEAEARARGLVETRKVLVKKESIREEVPISARGAR